MTCARLSVKVAQGCEKPWSSPPHAAPPRATQCLNSFPKGSRGANRTAQFLSFPSLPSLISAPSTRANQPSPVQGRQEREPCRLLWVAPRRLAPGRVENGGGRGNCSVKLGRVNMHVGSRSAAIGLDLEARPCSLARTFKKVRSGQETRTGERRKEGGRKA